MTDLKQLFDKRKAWHESVYDLVVDARELLRVHLKPDSPQHERDAFDKLQTAKYALGADPLSEEVIAALIKEVAGLRRVATDRLYMMQAYYNMLGPKGREVADAWAAKGLIRTHVDWGPDAAELTGEERAAVLLRVEADISSERELKL